MSGIDGVNKILQLTNWTGIGAKYSRVGMDLVIQQGATVVKTESNFFSLENMRYLQGVSSAAPIEAFDRIVFSETAVRVDEILAQVFTEIRGSLTTGYNSENKGLYKFVVDNTVDNTVVSYNFCLSASNGNIPVGMDISNTWVNVQSMANVVEGLKKFGHDIAANTSNYIARIFDDTNLVSIAQYNRWGRFRPVVTSGIN